MKRLLLMIIVLFSVVLMEGKSGDGVASYYNLPEGLTSEDYQQGTIILKEKKEFKGVLSGTEYNGVDYLNFVLENLVSTAPSSIYPHHRTPKQEKNSMGLDYIDLSLIHQIQYSSNIQIQEAINKLLSTGFFEYVEPLFLHKLLYNPNDPNFGTQHYLNMVQAVEAWDITTGDTNIVIGITDTGIEKLHDDIINKIKYNYDDPINGSDDDGDGYIDNFYGWDMGDNDNDPEISGSQHGLWVAGIAGMEADNSSHGAGVGFDTKILPVKIRDAAGTLAQAYPGIVYAADQGCRIINCSWGSANSWSQYGQDIVSYATINQDALVVCAAGNTNSDVAYYPASFTYAISCATVKPGDERDNWATYNKNVDLASPGASMKTTMQANGWGDVGAGSSFASPVVAGCAALVMEQYPSYNAIQIGERLKVTADVIDTIPANIPTAGKMGSGRVNVFNAVTFAGIPSINMTSQTFSSNLFVDGESIDVSGDFINYLDPSSSSLTAVMTTNSAFITITQSTVNLGVISMLGTMDNALSPFEFDILPGAPSNTSAELLITYTDGAYTATQCITVVINRDYADLDANDILVTVTSKGRMGYNQDNQAEGSGMTYQGGAPLFWEMNFMVAKSTSQVSFDRDGEFGVVNTIVVDEPGMESDKDINGLFNDDLAGGSKLDISVKNKALAWNEVGHENYFILEYKIINSGSVAIDGLYPALYTDWDIDVWNQNEATYDRDRHMGIVYKPSGTYAGVRLLTDTSDVNYYAFNNDGSNSSYSIYDGYSQFEQFNAASGGLMRENAPLGDVGHQIGAGPFAIAAGDSLVIAYAIIAGSDLASIEIGADSAAVMYNDIRRVEIALSAISNVSCKADTDGSATVSSTFGVAPYTYAWSDPGSQTGPTASGLSAGQYVVSVTDYVGNENFTNVIIGEPDLLQASLDSVYNASCNGSCNGTVDVSVTGGTMGYSYAWDDLTLLPVPNPNMCAGDYELVITDNRNCTDTVNVTIVEPDLLTSSIIDTVQVTILDSCNATATVQAIGGSGNYTYLWDDENDQTTAQATGLCVGDYSVTVTDSNGCETISVVSINFPAGINKSFEEVKLDLFPNPCQSVITLLLQDQSPFHYTVYNLIGQEMKEGISQSGREIEVSTLRNGYYFIEITSDNTRMIKEFEILK